MPKQAACAAIITSDSCGLSFWAEDLSQIHIFVTSDENGLIENYRVEYGDSRIYDGEVEISFDDLYQQAEGDWKETYRAELPGTVEYQFKREADKLAQEAGETWMDAEQREQFRQVCNKIDQIKSARDFRCTMPLLGYDYDKKIINAARKFKKCNTAAQYETERETLDRVAQEAREAAKEIPCPDWMNKAQKEDFREICGLIDTIKSGRDFYRVMNLINGGLDRDEVEALWWKVKESKKQKRPAVMFGWANADRLKPNKKGIANMAGYMVQDSTGKKHWTQSQNLEKPWHRPPNDNKYTHKQLQKIAKLPPDSEEYRAFWGKKYKGWELVDSERQYVEQSGRYFYLTMRRKC